MTAVGKILVFFNLIFSLVVGAFVVMVYISQTHWAAEYNDLSAKYQVDEASLSASQKEVQKARDYADAFDKTLAGDKDLALMAGLSNTDDAATKLTKIKDTIKTLQKVADDQTAKANTLNDKLVANTQKLEADDAALTSARAEVEKRQAESAATRDMLAQETKKNLDLVKEKDKANDEMVAFKIRADSAEMREKQLEAENDKLARDNQRLVASAGPLAPAATKNGPNPPPENVEGLVSEVDPSGLVRLTIGSDAGLAKGNTLEVYRLNTQYPDQSKYLGRLKVVQVANTESVAEMMNKPPLPLQPGDTVSSRIGR